MRHYIILEDKFKKKNQVRYYIIMNKEINRYDHNSYFQYLAKLYIMETKLRHQMYVKPL